MIDWLAHLLGGGAVGLVLTMIVATIRQGPNRPNFPFARWLFIFSTIVWVGPFVAMEFFTRKLDASLGSAVRNYFESAKCPLQEKMAYYKVLWSNGERATVIMVGKELEAWGGYDYPVMKLKLAKKVVKGKDVWSVIEGDVLRSVRLDTDSFIWPPVR